MRLALLGLIVLLPFAPLPYRQAAAVFDPGAPGGPASGSAVAASAPAPAATPAPAPAAAPAVGGNATAAAERNPLDALRFLFGRWEASGAGRPGASAGAFSFDVAAGGRALVRHNASQSPEGLHQDVMLIYLEGPDSLRALYTDSEGHLIHYALDSPAPKEVVLLSDAAPGAPRYRLSYRLRPDGSLGTTFEVAAPGGDFQTYLDGVAHRAMSFTDTASH